MAYRLTGVMVHKFSLFWWNRIVYHNLAVDGYKVSSVLSVT